MRVKIAQYFKPMPCFEGFPVFLGVGPTAIILLRKARHIFGIDLKLDCSCRGETDYLAD
jgi:hypothetical protein